MISKEMSQRADNYDIQVVEDNATATWVLVGYLVRFNKKTQTMSCNCKSEVFGSKCSHKLALRKVKEIPIEVRESLENEEVIK